ncbi:MAG: serine protein kinase RIO [Nanohaloarchaea archaeon]|nr:serine protein kinase RIO [Candidatus Nanohaloarchaea archaeon]
MAKQKIDKDRKIFEDVFDSLTVRTLEKLKSKKHFAAISGIIKSGKEGQVFNAIQDDDTQVAVKIYMIETSSFQNMQDYIKGDRRFFSIGKNKKKLVYAWCAKEYRNLKKAYEVGVSVPNPIAFLGNILIMELVSDNGQPAKHLAKTELDNPKQMFDMVLSEMKKFYFDAGLVHADLSEFNIIVRDGKPIIIDVGQSVLLNHPMAKQFQRRDVENIVNFFNKHKLDIDSEEILNEFEK